MGTDMQPSIDRQDAERPLDGWKEIASYLNRHVATVRRWEKTEALPVHRHLHDKLGSVYAFRSELDAWWRSRRARLEAEHAADMGEERAVDASVDPPAPEEATVPLGSRAVLRWSHGRVLGGALVVAVAAVAYGVGHGETPRREIRSLAVLPLQHFATDSAHDSFADGMTDALITNLAQVQDLRVISRTSVMRFKDTRQPLPEIARQLGADAILHGSVQRAGHRVKITIQLVDGRSDHHIWAREYERDLSDVLKLQGELARAVTGEIGARITTEARARFASAPTIDPVAHEAYLLGRYHAWKMNDEDLRLAITHFERATAIHPRYAAAYADLSLAWQYRSVFASTPFSESEAPARAAAEMAVALDAGLAAAHLAMGHFKYAYNLDFAGAEADLRRAVDLDPNSADAHYYYAKLLQSLTRFPEAIHHIERARDLDPLSSSVASFLGRTLYRSGDYEKAVPHLKRAMELEPRNIGAHSRLMETYEEMARYDEALAYHQREYTRTGSRRHLARIARLQARMGRRDEARQTLERIYASEDGEVPQTRAVASGMTVELAAVHAALGDGDEAFRLLMHALDAREHARLLFIKADPPFASLRADPRWKDLLGRMKLPH